MFAFPADPDKREKWKRAIPRIEGGRFTFDSPHTRVCEKHFDRTDVVWHDEFIINGEKVLHKRGKPKLREDAVPRIFNGCPSYLSTPKPRSRSVRQRAQGNGSVKRKRAPSTPTTDTVSKPSSAGSESSFHDTDDVQADVGTGT